MIGGLYRCATALAGPVLPLWLRVRAARGKEDPDRLPERRGVAARARPAGRLAWFHAASMGEAASILPLVNAVIDRGWNALVTTGTVTSAQMLAGRLPAHAVHQFAPLDRRAWVARFLDHWRPDLALWTESELWPNALAEIHGRRIPAVLVNGRLSDRSFRGWRRWPAFAREVMGAFTFILAQSDEDARRFAALGAADVRAAGNLKFAAPHLAHDDDALDALNRAVGDRPRWLAASIHPGEDAVAAEVHARLTERWPDLLTVIVPRHVIRGAEMAAAAAARGLTALRRSEGALPAGGTHIYVADTMGELGLFYRLCDLVFIGKTLAVGGGQNPVEPAQLGCALLFGPAMGNFRDMGAALVAAGAAAEVGGAAALADALARLLADSTERRRRGEAARAFMAAHARALEDTLGHLAPLLA